MARTGAPTDHGAQEAHRCLPYRSEEAWLSAVGAFVADGLGRRERVLYFTEGVGPDRVAAMLGGSGVDVGPALRRRQLDVRPAREGFRTARSFDPDRAIAGMREAVDRSLDDGWTGLRFVGDMSWCHTEERTAGRVLEYELRFGAEVLADLPVTALCLYDRRVVPEPLAALYARAHRTHAGARDADGRVDGDGADGDAGSDGAGPDGADWHVPLADEVWRMPPIPLAVAPLAGHSGMRLIGSADLDTRPVLGAALAALRALPGEDVHLDLSRLAYMDAAGAAALLGTARALGDRRLVLRRPPWSLRRVFELFREDVHGMEVRSS